MKNYIIGSFLNVCEKYSNEKLDCVLYSVFSGLNIMRLVL